MSTTLKAIVATLIGVAVWLPGAAVAGATPTVAPLAPKTKCQVADNQLCPPPLDVKAKKPKGFNMPKVPRGY